MNWDYPELYYKIYPKLLESLDEHLGPDCSFDIIRSRSSNHR